MFKKKKNSDLYLSDLQPLSAGGKTLLTITYIILLIWAAFILVPLAIMVIFTARNMRLLKEVELI